MQVYKQHCKIAEEYHEVKKEIALLEERKWVIFLKYLLLCILFVKSCFKHEGFTWYFLTLYRLSDSHSTAQQLDHWSIGSTGATKDTELS